MPFGSGAGDIPGLTPPPVLIFFHIPKTGGLTIKSVVQHCLQDQCFDCELPVPDTALWVCSTANIAQKFYSLSAEERRVVRCVVGEHVSFDVASIFSLPSKFFTIVREPVDRVVSHFYFSRTWHELPSHQFIRDMTLEEYLDSGMGLDYDNHQVRMLSGCPELDSPWTFERGRLRISAPPVTRRHLAMAKRNIEKRFIVAAPMEQLSALVWFLKRLYGWPIHRALYRIHHKTPGRPKVQSLSQTTRKRLEASNEYDSALYEWVKERFATQIEPLEPDFSRQVRRFEVLNSSFRRLHPFIPQPILAAVARLPLSHRASWRAKLTHKAINSSVTRHYVPRFLARQPFAKDD